MLEEHPSELNVRFHIHQEGSSSGSCWAFFQALKKRYEEKAHLGEMVLCLLIVGDMRCDQLSE